LAADVNQDGEVDSTDITLLKRYILRKIDKFPVVGKSSFDYQAAVQYHPAPNSYLTPCSQPGKVVKETYSSINGTKSLNVYLPYGYDSKKKI
jgi:hypothetical protein